MSFVASSVCSCSRPTRVASAIGRVASASSREGANAVRAASCGRDGRELQRPQRGGIRGCAGGRLSARHAGRPRSSTDTAAGPLGRVSDADARPAGDRAPAATRLDADRPRRRRSVPLSRRSKPKARPRLPGPRCQLDVGHCATAHPSELAPLVDLRRAQEDRLRLGARPAHDVRAMVQPVDEVDVERPRTGRTSPRCAPCARATSVPPGLPAPRMPRPRRSGRRRAPSGESWTSRAPSEVARDLARGTVEPGSVEDRGGRRRRGAGPGHRTVMKRAISPGTKGRTTAPTVGMIVVRKKSTITESFIACQ